MWAATEPKHPQLDLGSSILLRALRADKLVFGDELSAEFQETYRDFNPLLRFQSKPMQQTKRTES